MPLKLHQLSSKMPVLIGSATLLLCLLSVGKALGLWISSNEILPRLHSPSDVVIDLCDAATKMPDAQAAQPCRWVIPGKYVYKTNYADAFIEARVPMADIDPTYASDPKNKVIFQFGPDGPDYANGIRRKSSHLAASHSSKHGFMRIQSRQELYFEGFDGVEVYVYSTPNFSSPLPHARIYRPLSPSGDMHWIVPFPPNLASQYAMDSYVQHHIKEIDRKLMQFINQWH